MSRAFVYSTKRAGARTGLSFGENQAARQLQFGNLNDAMRVFQLTLPLAAMYCCVYQKVQSLAGSICIME